MTPRELLRLHIEAVWEISVPALDLATIELSPGGALPPWSIYQARLAHDCVTIWRPDVSPGQRDALLQRVERVGSAPESAHGMRREVVLRPRFAAADALRAPILRPLHAARLLTSDDAALVEAFEAESAAYFLSPQHAPCFGVIVDGQLVSVAHSSRRTQAACELGINTTPTARRRGYATAATIAWTEAIRREGLLPIYSAFAENTASLGLAAVAGYEREIESVYGPVVATDE